MPMLVLVSLALCLVVYVVYPVCVNKRVSRLRLPASSLELANLNGL